MDRYNSFLGAVSSRSRHRTVKNLLIQPGAADAPFSLIHSATAYPGHTTIISAVWSNNEGHHSSRVGSVVSRRAEYALDDLSPVWVRVLAWAVGRSKKASPWAAGQIADSSNCAIVVPGGIFPTMNAQTAVPSDGHGRRMMPW